MPGRRHRCRGRRGRRRGKRWIDKTIKPVEFTPTEKPEIPKKTILITLDELEALRLVDLEELTQQEAAAMMGVSRKTLWNDLHRARKKITRALVKAYPIRIEGGDYIQRKKEYGGEK
ncbi:MAG: DUF134 domain-containing protein [Candidatus Thermoplasmatota archaeon]